MQEKVLQSRALLLESTPEDCESSPGGTKSVLHICVPKILLRQVTDMAEARIRCNHLWVSSTSLIALAMTSWFSLLSSLQACFLQDSGPVAHSVAAACPPQLVDILEEILTNPVVSGPDCRAGHTHASAPLSRLAGWHLRHQRRVAPEAAPLLAPAAAPRTL